MRTIVLALGVVAVSATIVAAGECPTLQAQVDKEYGRRFDKTAAVVRATAKEAEALHKAGKHADSIKKYDDAAKAGGMKLTHKK